MSQVSDLFDGLLANLKVDNDDPIGKRRDEITKSLNREFRGLEGATTNKLMVGSYGRWTAIKGISDLDLLFILPNSLRAQYERDGGPSKVLTRTRLAIQARYPATSVKVDRLVVVVQFTNFMFEVQPVFENDDKSFSYPDSRTDSWKVTKPRSEMTAVAVEDALAGGSLRHLCKFVRAWRNKHGLVMGGLLIDTLAYNFFGKNADYRSATSATYDLMVRDFFLYLSEEADHDHYSAPGSRQHVKVKKKFQSKAKKAYNLAVEAVAAVGQKNLYKKWRSVFGNTAPSTGVLEAARTGSATSTFTNTEQFIEDMFPVDIRYSVTIDCEVTQNGFRSQSLRVLLMASGFLRPKKRLAFTITHIDVPSPYAVRWKVLNRGPEAERRNNIRGQIIKPSSGTGRVEHTSFRGEHYVECYVLRNGVVVARDGIEVPISGE